MGHYGSPGGAHSDFVFIFHFSVFVFNVLIFTSPFSFSVFVFYFSVSLFNVLIFTSPFCSAVEMSVFIFLLFHFCFLLFFKIKTEISTEKQNGEVKIKRLKTKTEK